MGIFKLTAYHGTDKSVASDIVESGFRCKPNNEHWLGEGIYLYIDKALAEWWTTKPTKKHGTNITQPVIVECSVEVSEERVLNLCTLGGYKKYIDLFEISDIEKIKKYVLSEEIWEEFPGDISLNYLTELVSWQEADDGMIRIFVRYDVESEYDYVEFLVGIIKEDDEGIMLNTSEEFVEYDTDVFNKQIEHTTLYRHYTEQMKISRVGYVQETAVTSAIVFSGVLGMILSVAIVLSQFIKNRQPGKEEKN